MPSSGGGPTLEVSQAGLATVAATLTSSAGSLAALAAAPPVHAPLAADEVSTSAAARLSDHGGVLSSRASDGAAVLAAAAQAVLAVSTQMAEIDQANATALALGAQMSAPVGGPASAAATKVHAVAANTPITPMAPRPGEVTAALIETGSSSTGTTFQSSCRAYGSAFEACAVAARNAQSALAAGITGRTGPRLSTALSKFAAWADQMASHAESVAQSAQEHGSRFEQTQHDTPRTQQFAVTRASLDRAQMLNLQTGGMASGLVAQYASRLQQLDATATAAGVSYHLTELPQAPPPPPPVTDIVDDNAAPSEGSGQQPGEPEPEEPTDRQSAAEQADSTADADTAPDVLGGEDDLLAGDPLGAGDIGGSAIGGPMQQIAPMAAMLPSAVAGALGGAMGAVTSVPQQVMGAAQQVMQGAAARMTEPDLGLDMDPLDAGLTDFGGGGLGSGGGGGGGVEAAGVDTSLPPGGGALAAASAPSGGPPPISSSAAVSTPNAAPAGAGGMGGMMMPPPMMGGMGAGGGGNAGRTPPPDKTVVIPSIPNGEPVKGEVERRQVASVEAPDQAKAEAGEPSGRPRRRVVVAAPPDPDAEAK
ncbi:MAG: hypothetical protein AB7G47_14370 [Mycolicibacterium sp.]|uniref:hypothetical protein n=1 Tax=Mycolicibacterium sp. TaxID=2320850 RepID=UPI003D0B751D